MCCAAVFWLLGPTAPHLPTGLSTWPQQVSFMCVAVGALVFGAAVVFAAWIPGTVRAYCVAPWSLEVFRHCWPIIKAYVQERENV